MFGRILGLVMSPLGKLVGAAGLVAAVLLGARRSGQNAERVKNLQRQLEASEVTHEIKDAQLEAAARRPRDRDGLVDRMRDGSF